MALITILIALVVQRFANMAGWFKSIWFGTYMEWLRPILTKCNKWLALAVLVLPVFLVLGIVHYLLSLRLFGLFYLVLSSVILLLCMDARNLKSQLAKYFEHAEKGEVESASEAITEVAGGPVSAMETFAEVNRYVTGLILEKSYLQIFSILFWFGIFGIYGASGYAILVLTQRLAVKVDGSFDDIAGAAGSIRDVLDWLPARILGFSYALVGQFTNGFSYCTKNLKLNLSDSMGFVVEAGLSALGANADDIANKRSNLQENYAALALIDRTLAAWIVAIALITFGMLL